MHHDAADSEFMMWKCRLNGAKISFFAEFDKSSAGVVGIVVKEILSNDSRIY